jgi:E3 ubiquitin-protein ligase HUWE1
VYPQLQGPTLLCKEKTCRLMYPTTTTTLQPRITTIIVSFINVLGRVSGGRNRSRSHFADGFSCSFCKVSSSIHLIARISLLTRMGRLIALPCHNFANSVASDSMVPVMGTLTEVSTNETLLHLAQLAKEFLEATRYFWEKDQEDSKLLPLVDITSQPILQLRPRPKIK